jgi:HNH endonuclease
VLRKINYDTTIMTTNPSLKERFFSKTKKMECGCLEWTACLDKSGYARIQVDGKFKIAARIAWQLEHGVYPDKSMCVCHTCDNPRCVNVKHLWLGTHKENFEDAVAKGRRTREPVVPSERRARGEGHAKTKLTVDQVKEIKTRLAVGESGFYTEYGISRSLLSDIKTGRTWSHVNID